MPRSPKFDWSTHDQPHLGQVDRWTGVHLCFWRDKKIHDLEYSKSAGQSKIISKYSIAAMRARAGFRNGGGQGVHLSTSESLESDMRKREVPPMAYGSKDRSCRGKLRNLTKEDARSQIRWLAKSGAAFWQYHIYKCKDCGGYHVAHYPRRRRAI